MKPLYETESVYTFDEYKKGILAVNERFNIRSSTQAALGISIGVFLIALASGRYQVVSSGFFRALVLFPLVWILAYAFKSQALSVKAEQRYNSDAGLQDLIVKFKFFWNLIEVRHHHSNANDYNPKAIEFAYSDFNKIIETKTNFYLMTTEEAKEPTFFLVKENCSEKLIAFMQEHARILASNGGKQMII